MSTKQGVSNAKHMPTYRAQKSLDGSVPVDDSAGWIVVSDDGLLCSNMCKAEAEMVANACNSHDALTSENTDLRAQVNRDTEVFKDMQADLCRKMTEKDALVVALEHIKDLNAEDPGDCLVAIKIAEAALKAAKP